MPRKYLRRYFSLLDRWSGSKRRKVELLSAYKKGYLKGVLDSEWGQITSEELIKEKHEN